MLQIFWILLLGFTACSTTAMTSAPNSAHVDLKSLDYPLQRYYKGPAFEFQAATCSPPLKTNELQSIFVSIIEKRVPSENAALQIGQKIEGSKTDKNLNAAIEEVADRLLLEQLSPEQQKDNATLESMRVLKDIHFADLKVKTDTQSQLILLHDQLAKSYSQPRMNLETLRTKIRTEESQNIASIERALQKVEAARLKFYEDEHVRKGGDFLLHPPEFISPAEWVLRVRFGRKAKSENFDKPLTMAELDRPLSKEEGAIYPRALAQVEDGLKKKRLSTPNFKKYTADVNRFQQDVMKPYTEFVDKECELKNAALNKLEAPIVKNLAEAQKLNEPSTEELSKVAVLFNAARTEEWKSRRPANN